MSTALPTGRPHKGRPEDGVNGWHPASLEDVAEALQATRDRTLRRDCLESRDRAYRWCVRKTMAEGPRWRSTLMQAAKGMGYPLTDDDEQNFRSWSSSVRRCLDDLQAAGLIQSWGGVKRPDGRWRCIEVCMPCEAKPRGQRTIMIGRGTYVPPLVGRFRSGTGEAGPEPLGGVSRARLPRRRTLTPEDRRQPHRPSSTARRIFFGGRELTSPEGVFPPSGVKTPSRPVARARDREQPGMDRGCAAATDSRGSSAAAPPPGSREGPGPGEPPRRGRGGPGQKRRRGEPGRAAATSPVDGVPAPRAALLARFGELFGAGAAERFSHRLWGARLDRALERLDRYADSGRGRRGEGVRFVIGVMEGTAELCEPGGPGGRRPPASLAYFVPIAEEESKIRRRHQAARTREAPAGWRHTWANPKEKSGRRAGAGDSARRPDTTKRE